MVATTATRFATNFNPEINIREITQRGRYWENGEWVEIDPMSQSRTFDFPEVGERKAYLLYHEELESLVKHIDGLKRIRFWMTFGEEYLTHLRVLQNVGMTGIDPIEYEGREIVPIQFLKAMLPDPSTLGENYTGKTSIGCLIEGRKNGEPPQGVHLQRVRPRGVLEGSSGPGGLVHDRRPNDGWRQDDADQPVARPRRFQRRATRSRAVPGRARSPWASLAREGAVVLPCDQLDQAESIRPRM